MYCIICISPYVLPNVRLFTVTQNLTLPPDHPIVSLSFSNQNLSDCKNVLKRAIDLSEYNISQKKVIRRSICYETLNKKNVIEQLKQVIPPPVNDVNICIKWINDKVYEIAANSIKQDTDKWDVSINRWHRLLDSGNTANIWKAINWKGGIYHDTKRVRLSPTPSEFKDHFAELLVSDEVVDLTSVDISESPFIPILYIPLTMKELEESVIKIKPNKACDSNGNSPGILRLFPPLILSFILDIFNNIIIAATYPVAWTLSKFIVIFKKGDTMLCKNYRGIAINDILFRLFDSMLGRRLSMWYIPSKEQVGSQKGRSCIDHIMTIRLIIDYAKKARVKLYILFIDFEKAYDKVSRNKLIEELKILECGKVMLQILINIYKNTNLLIKSANIYTNKGVKQGSTTSCILFLLYIDRMIKMIKEHFETDGFLGALHILMLMDDKVLLPTSKEGLINKFKICQQYCTEYGMSVNVLKTKFIVLNMDEADKESIISNNITVKYCTNYKYLGTFITDDGAYKTVLDLHIKE